MADMAPGIGGSSSGADADILATSPLPARSLVPSRQLLAIEHPCYVTDADAGLAMLGGSTCSLARACVSNSNFIECSLRPEDPLCHPLFGVLGPSPGLLLKVTRKRESGCSTSEPSGIDTTAVTVVGKVKSSYRFEGLADYQYATEPSVRDALAARPARPGEPFDVVESLKPFEAHAMHVPPALFSAHDTPLEFLPRSQKAGARVFSGERQSSGKRSPAENGLSSEAPIRRRRSRAGMPVPMHFGQRVDFLNDESPEAPLEHVARTINPDDDLFAAMKSKFAQRPVWSRQALLASLPGSLNVTPERLRYRLPQLAYYFSQGPWRMCWISFGYDPRKSVDSRIYQVLDLRLPNEIEHPLPKKAETSRIGAPARIRRGPALDLGLGTCEIDGGDNPFSKRQKVADAEETLDSGEDALSEGHALIPGDQSLPTQRKVYFQMCDFTVDAIVQLVHEAPTDISQCHERLGWYTQETMDQLRKLLKQTLIDLAKDKSGRSMLGALKRKIGGAEVPPLPADKSLAARSASRYLKSHESCGAVSQSSTLASSSNAPHGQQNMISCSEQPFNTVDGVTCPTWSTSSAEAFGIFGDDVYEMGEEDFMQREANSADVSSGATAASLSIRNPWQAHYDPIGDRAIASCSDGDEGCDTDGDGGDECAGITAALSPSGAGQSSLMHGRDLEHDSASELEEDQDSDMDDRDAERIAVDELSDESSNQYDSDHDGDDLNFRVE